MTPETLAAMAIAWLGGKAVETGGRLAAAGYQYAEQKLFDWLKARFDTADDAGALKRLEDKPESPAVRSRLTAEVLEAMENDTALVAELEALLKEANVSTTSINQTATTTGDGNSTVQIAGHGNKTG